MWKVSNLLYNGIKAMVLQPGYCQNWVEWATPNIQYLAHSKSSDLTKMVLWGFCVVLKWGGKIRSYCRSVISGAVFSKAYLNSRDVKTCKCMCHIMGEVCSLYLMVCQSRWVSDFPANLNHYISRAARMCITEQGDTAAILLLWWGNGCLGKFRHSLEVELLNGSVPWLKSFLVLVQVTSVTPHLRTVFLTPLCARWSVPRSWNLHREVATIKAWNRFWGFRKRRDITVLQWSKGVKRKGQMILPLPHQHSVHPGSKSHTSKPKLHKEVERCLHSLRI